MPPVKMKYLRANHSHFVTKELNKGIMLRLEIPYEIYLKCKSEKAGTRFKFERNFCVTLLRKTIMKT